MFKMISGLALVVGGIALGLYAGLWWAFVGGIVDIINAIKAPDLSAMAIAIGVVKIVCAGAIGAFSALVPCAIGAAMFKGA